MKHTRFLPALTCLLLAQSVQAADLLPPGRSIPEAVDHYIDQALAEQKITPAAFADDATLIRRLTLDLCGRIPTHAETQAYVSSTKPDKKVELIERLMASNAYLRHQVNEFDAMLAAESPGGRRGGQGSLKEYLSLAMKDRRGWDTIFRDLILADEKDSSRKGATTFLKSRIKDQDRLTTDVSVLFFGVNISCAQCHDHPLVQDWKQDHYYGLKSFLARTYEAGAFLGERDAAVVEFKTTKNVSKKATLMFLTGKLVEDPHAKKLSPEELKALESKAKKRQQPADKKKQAGPPEPPKWSARAALAEVALQEGQRDFFAKSIVNRLWHRHFGLGLVSPIDQMHSENAASHPQLLDWLARDMSSHGYDVHRMIRGLLLSKTYARSSRFEGERWPAIRSFAVARLRPLTPMQYATSLRLATTDPAQFPADLKPEELDRRLESVENSARDFARQIEQPRDDFQISVSEALLFSNSDRVIRDFLTDGRDRLLGKIKEIKSPDQALDLLVRVTMSRPITQEEKSAMLDYLAQRRDRESQAYQQITWALLSSAEFRFNY